MWVKNLYHCFLLVFEAYLTRLCGAMQSTQHRHRLYLRVPTCTLARLDTARAVDSFSFNLFQEGEELLGARHIAVLKKIIQENSVRYLEIVCGLEFGFKQDCEILDTKPLRAMLAFELETHLGLVLKDYSWRYFPLGKAQDRITLCAVGIKKCWLLALIALCESLGIYLKSIILALEGKGLSLGVEEQDVSLEDKGLSLGVGMALEDKGMSLGLETETIMRGLDEESITRSLEEPKEWIYPPKKSGIAGMNGPYRTPHIHTDTFEFLSFLQRLHFLFQAYKNKIVLVLVVCMGVLASLNYKIGQVRSRLQVSTASIHQASVPLQALEKDRQYYDSKVKALAGQIDAQVQLAHCQDYWPKIFSILQKGLYLTGHTCLDSLEAHPIANSSKVCLAIKGTIFTQARAQQGLEHYKESSKQAQFEKLVAALCEQTEEPFIQTINLAACQLKPDGNLAFELGLVVPRP